MKKNIIIFTDSGDTLVNESTQIYDSADPECVIKADLIENAGQVIEELHDAGYRIALVADGNTRSFRNVLGEHDLLSCFEAMIISEEVGEQKPSRKMFDTAMKAMGLEESDKSRIIMVGNNLKKDIAGANDYGITSVWLDWSPRYSHKYEEPSWKPDYIIHHPSELPWLIRGLENEFSNKRDTGE